ncbi:glycosyltransferase [Fimbriiglobus ruber]|uniref:glycosyltransferase n=1 Tax=Fimbriiglobus ruber TaxID=1908690 RepID=UPI0023B945B3|nr:glycosyltransferase [Fimbriiglobus ruber]
MAKDVPPYAVVVGNPARVIMYRFDPETVTRLLKIRWWDWPEEQIKAAADLIWSDRVAEFIERHESGTLPVKLPSAVPPPDEFGSLPIAMHVEIPIAAHSLAGEDARGTPHDDLPKRPRVLFVSYHCYVDPSSGAALCTRDLFELLTARGWKCAVVTGPQLDDHSATPIGTVLAKRPGIQRVSGQVGTLSFSVYRSDADGFPVTIVAPDPPSAHRQPIREEVAAFHDVVKRTVADFRPDVVLTYGGDPASHAAIAEIRKAGIPVVFWLHNRAYTGAAFFRAFAAVVVPSESSRDHYREQLGLDPVVLPGPWEWNRFRCELDGPPHVTFVNPEPAKGVFWFARIADVLGRSRPDIAFLVVNGRGQANWLDKCRVNLKGVNSIRIMANTPDPRKFYRQSKLVLMPSLVPEGLSRVAVESLANGIPIIGSGRGGMTEVFKVGGVRVDIPDVYTPDTRIAPTADEVRAWVDAIVRLWDDSNEYAQVSMSARQNADRVWSPHAVAPRWEEFLMRVAVRV